MECEVLNNNKYVFRQIVSSVQNAAKYVLNEVGESNFSPLSNFTTYVGPYRGVLSDLWFLIWSFPTYLYMHRQLMQDILLPAYP